MLPVTGGIVTSIWVCDRARSKRRQVAALQSSLDYAEIKYRRQAGAKTDNLRLTRLRRQRFQNQIYSSHQLDRGETRLVFFDRTGNREDIACLEVRESQPGKIIDRLLHIRGRGSRGRGFWRWRGWFRTTRSGIRRLIRESSEYCRD